MFIIISYTSKQNKNVHLSENVIHSRFLNWIEKKNKTKIKIDRIRKIRIFQSRLGCKGKSKNCFHGWLFRSFFRFSFPYLIFVSSFFWYWICWEENRKTIDFKEMWTESFFGLLGIAVTVDFWKKGNNNCCIRILF